MKMGEYIKKLREEHEWTQEELGAKLDPPVNRAAVNKWETGQVENIKRRHIQQLARLFNVKACELMCFDDNFDSSKVAEETKVLELIQKHYGKDALELLQQFQELNSLGREKALENISDLASLPKYTDSIKKESLNA